ncbi:hypothetical protein [Bythopirellula goksoeyrii]|uniref:hypothetical protein n=1 Tax=Bythopirellula goksoeyrii TaxID=1400387 RepID=UPI0011CD806C|nr:hypothetical protein [Bythopirellula goksoeyrii]
MAVDTSKWAEHEVVETDATGDVCFVLAVASTGRWKNFFQVAAVSFLGRHLSDFATGATR